MAQTNRAAARKPEKEPEYDAGHVPITEEFDSPRHTLPNVIPLLIALGVVAIVIGVLAYVFRAKPAAAGNIDSVFALQQASGTTTWVAMNITLTNTTKKPLVIQGIKSELTTNAGAWTDDAAPAVDYPRYVQAYPDLGNHTMEPLKLGARIPPGELLAGTVLVAFPTTKSDFDQRKSLSVTIYPKDNAPVTFTK